VRLIRERQKFGGGRDSHDSHVSIGRQGDRPNDNWGGVRFSGIKDSYPGSTGRETDEEMRLDGRKSRATAIGLQLKNDCP